MNFEDDLSAPVWDELNEPSTHTVDELSGSLSNLSTHKSPIALEQHTDTETTHDDQADYPQNREIKEIHQTESHQTDASHHLLEELAPEKEALSDLNIGNSSAPVTPVKTTQDPLFSGSTYLPLVEDSDRNFDESITVTSSNDESSSIKRKAGKPQRLFNSARIRRRPISLHAHSIAEGTQKDEILDPLGRSKKENEFSDEPLDDVLPNTQFNAKNDSIIDMVDEPLFKLSPKKKNNRAAQSEGNNDLNGDTNGKVERAPAVKEVSLEKFEIEVRDPVKVGELTSMHVEYTVSTKSNLIKDHVAQTQRRYTDFRWLYRQLQSNHWGMIIPPPPEKQSVGRFKQDFIENRRFQMERMLRKIVESPILQKDPDFLMFLSSSDFAMDSKTREYISGSAASNDSNDLSEIHISEIQLLGAEDAATVLKNGGIDAESQKRFMNISFTSTPKYIETDDYFREQWRNAEIFEEQLKQLDKALELVDSERNELASVTEEFSKTIKSLAELEVTKKNADLLSNFAETHQRIKESLERSSLQESLTLGVTLDEYLRSLASFKAIFNQRAKLGQYLVIVEGDLAKKESQLEKLHNVFKSQPNSEKVLNAKKEYQVIQTRFNNIKKSWQTIGNKIRDEIDKYQLEKVQDFRNSIEIFLESAIESQKESIELWETFYQNNL